MTPKRGATVPEEPQHQDTPPVEAEPVTPLTASHEGSVHQTLARLREGRRFEPLAEPETEPEAAPLPEEEKELPAESQESSGLEAETEPEALPAEKTREGPGAEGGFKYRSQEEAERAYREAEKRMHQATTEKAELQREVEALKERLAALEQRRPEEKPPPEPPSQEEAVQRLMELNDRLDNLDPYDPDYQKHRAELEMEKVVILDAVRGRQAIPSPEVVKDLVRQELAVREQEAARARELEELQRRAVNLAESHGLDMKPGSWDYKQFWRAVRAGEVPGGDLETQVKALAEEILADKAALGQRTMKNLQKVHEANAVLERGGTPPPPGGKENYRPSSIHEIIASNRRRI